MALTVSPSDLRAAARAAARVKDVVTSAGRRCVWNRVHRLQACGDRLRLFTTDGSTFLEWSIPARGEADFDVLVDGAGFNGLATRVEDDPELSLAASDGLLLTQGRRNLRLPEQELGAYPPRPHLGAGGRNSLPAIAWSGPAAPLAEAFAFIFPFVTPDHANASHAVATWTTEGALVGGTPEKAGIVSGLAAPAVSLSFRRVAAAAIAAFLSRLGDEVRVYVEDDVCVFACPAAGHELIVGGEAAHFPKHALAVPGGDSESFIVDRRMLLSAVEILGVFLPGRKDRLDVRVRGRGQDASLLLSTPEAAVTRSTDEFAIVRYPADENGWREGPSPQGGQGIFDTSFSIGASALQSALGALGGTTLTCRHDGLTRRMIIGMAPSEGRGVRAVLLALGKRGGGRDWTPVPSAPHDRDAVQRTDPSTRPVPIAVRVVHAAPEADGRHDCEPSTAAVATSSERAEAGQGYENEIGCSRGDSRSPDPGTQRRMWVRFPI